jgi:hypothetical protein
MRLSFKRLGFGFVEREVPVLLKMGTLEDFCDAFEIDFWQIQDLKLTEFDFNVELIWQGYLTACRQTYKKPKYDKVKASIWIEHMSQTSKVEWIKMISELMGRIKETTVKKKEAKKIQK